ncbi:hypothetical protein LSAT2_008172 [Lamellibrachia satsuma]|nr:hypothetical protein LSAT2_008172 [Lamellibrachia satsuma]
MQTTTVLPPGGQQAGAVPMQNVVIMPQYVTSQPEPQVWTNYASKSSLILGATQIAIGLLCILFNAVAIGAHSTTAVVGHGIWGGLFFILTGAFGVMAGKLRTTCSIVTFMVLSILGAVIFVTFVMVLAAIGVAIDHDQGQKSAKAMDAVLLGLSLLEAVVAIWSSALGCSTVCCGRRSQSGIVMQQGPVMMNTGGTQVLYTTGTSYPQTGNMCQQQGIPSAVSQQQQFSSAPMTQHHKVALLLLLDRVLQYHQLWAKKERLHFKTRYYRT